MREPRSGTRVVPRNMAVDIKAGQGLQSNHNPWGPVCQAAVSAQLHMHYFKEEIHDFQKTFNEVHGTKK